MERIVVVLPAYNAEKTLEKTVNDIPRDVVDEIILVDDGSSDKTVEIASRLGLKHFSHPKNKGYGANQKTCYTLALQHGAAIVVLLHPDYQYDPKMIKYLVGLIADGYFDVVLGSRIRTRKEAIEGGMPAYKYFFNRWLTLIENLISGQNLSEWHTGMRAYRRKVLESIDFMQYSDDFVFDTQLLFQAIWKGFKIGEVPVPVKYFPEASSINFWRSVKYGFESLATASKFFLGRLVNPKR